MRLYIEVYGKTVSLLQVHMHGTDFHHTLSHFFSPDVFPPEYGGEGLGIEELCQAWTQELLQSENLLKQIASHPTGDISKSSRDALISEENETKKLTDGWCLGYDTLEYVQPGFAAVKQLDK